MKLMRYFISLFCVSCFLLSGCGSSSSKDKESSEDATSVEITAEGELTRADKSLSIKTHNNNAVLYLDCSSSMKGYINTTSDTKFKNIVSSLLYWKPTKAYTFDTKELPEIPREDFIDKINTRRIDWSSESDLTKMINTMVNKVKAGQVGISYLITDGIMSGSNKEIRESIEGSFNITSRGTLTARIADAVSEVDENISILVIKYTSNFTGRYYYYDNTYVDLVEKPRPFYVVAIGVRSMVKDLITQLQKESLMSGNQGLILLGDELPYTIALKASKTEGISIKDNQIIIGTSIRPNDYVVLKGDLSSLQPYMQTQEYFEKNGEVYIQYSQKGALQKLDSQYFSYEVNGSSVNLNIQAKYIRRNAMCFRLKYELPNWIGISSCDNDKNLSSSPIPKTFNFKYFVDGLSRIDDEEYITKVDTLKFK